IGLLMILVSAGVILGWGYPYLFRATILLYHLKYVRKLHVRLFENGILTDGKVISCKSSKNSTTEIRYQIISPDDGEVIKSSYITAAKKEFPSGCKVAVLYLNRYIHILL
ncbi:hypothetical protein, partial [Acidihalobacter prosperus]